jgi:predicted dehydrogenase
VKAVVHGETVHPTFEDGLQNQRVLAAVARSAESKRWVQT